MFRKPLFWIIFSIFSALCITFTARYFSKAFPVVTLRLTMDRKNALEEARKLDEKFAWGPKSFREAASFDEDTNTQNYVELEGGGKAAFAGLLSEKLYSPYAWSVRHFKALTTVETTIQFTPEGAPYGFQLKLPEKEPGNNVPAEIARRLAEKAASDEWHIAFSSYRPVEQSQEKRTGGRIDHSFVYELADKKIGEAKYRLRLEVCGDRFTGLTHYMQIPEAFDRRFQQMRSQNNIIATGASISFLILYILGGCVIGLFLLMRKRWVLWKKAVMLGAGIAFLQLVAQVNGWPLNWMSYDTAVSYQGFVIQHVISMLASFIQDAVLVSLSLMAAESLTRKAFPGQIQFWRLWSKGSLNTNSVAGRTVAGYLLVAVFSAYQVALYLSATKLLGWWSPSDTLFDPNILATYFPWFTSLAQALHAGVWEESLFRAVPLACAALIGQRFGKRNYWLFGALILEAIVFGGAHANYANEPAYARLVELILPAMGFGLIYIYFGLLPAMLLHFGFDVTWMSIPLFAASVPGIWIDRVAVILIALLPLWLAIFSRFVFGSKQKPGEIYYNGAWEPPLKAALREPVEQQNTQLMAPRLSIPVSFCIAAAGLCLWITAARFRSDAPKLELNSASAIAAATKALGIQGALLSRPWQPLAFINADPGDDDRFIWETAGEKVYGALLVAGYLDPPAWIVRFVKFKGDVAERAEEYDVRVIDKGEVLDVSHELPEARPGPALSLEQARGIVFSAIRKKYGLDPENLSEISATDFKRPDRKDWLFEFLDPAVTLLKEGQARISVRVAGNEVIDIAKYVFVPEQWERNERDRQALLQSLKSFSSIIILVFYIAGLTGGVIAWSGRRISASLFWRAFALLFTLNIVVFINGWQATIAGFHTEEPFVNQALTTAGIFLLKTLFLAFGTALMISLTQQWRMKGSNISLSRSAAYSAGWAFMLAGVLSLAARWTGFSMPAWPDFQALSATVPIVDAGVSPLMDYIRQAALLVFFFAIMDKFSGRWTKRRGLSAAAILLMGFVFSTYGFSDTLRLWLVSGAVFGAALLFAYIYMFRVNISIVPVALACLIILSRIRLMVFDAFPNAAYGGLISILLILGLSFLWFRELAD
jgi:hypothetical protein